MITVTDERFSVPPPPVQPIKRREHSNRSLTGLYRTGDKQYLIDCSSSPCATKCHFSNTELGEVIFDRTTEVLLATTKPVSNEYLTYLKRAIRQWKQQFGHY